MDCTNHAGSQWSVSESLSVSADTCSRLAAVVARLPCFLHWLQLSSRSRSGFSPTFQVSGRPAKGGVASAPRQSSCRTDFCTASEKPGTANAGPDRALALPLVPALVLDRQMPSGTGHFPTQWTPARARRRQIVPIAALRFARRWGSRRTERDMTNETGARAGWCHEQRCS